jgi:hypothetical protein
MEYSTMTLTTGIRLRMHACPARFAKQQPVTDDPSGKHNRKSEDHRH